MTNKTLLKLLAKISACIEAIDWIKKDKLTLKQAWDKCKRADWLIWFAAKAEMASHQEIVLVACDCAETVLKYIPKDEDRPRKAIEAARKWALEPSEVSRKAAADAAHAAAYAADAADAAAHAADAAAYAADAAAHAADAAAYAADAADAAAHAAYAAHAAHAAKQKELCKIVRNRIKLKET